MLRVTLALAAGVPLGADQSWCSSSSKPRRNDACWHGEFNDDTCCGESPAPCWMEPFTARRCCDVAERASSCTESDFAMLEGLQAFFDHGILPHNFPVPESPAALKEWLEGGELDTELERCAPMALASLTTKAELITDLDTDESLKVATLAMTAFGILEGAARARGTLGLSPHRFPENVVHESMSRLNNVFGLHSRPTEFVGKLMNLTGYGGDGDGYDVDEGCLTDGEGVDSCTRATPKRGGERGRKLIVSLTRFLIPRPDAVRAKVGIDPAVASEALVLAQLLGAADLRGIRDGDAQRLLTAACRDLVLTVPVASPNFQKLATGARAVASAMAQGTRGQYAEKGKDDVVLNFVDSVGAETRFYAEIGVGPSGRECNTRVLRQHRGWKGVMLDQSNKNEAIGLYRRLMRADTIASVFRELEVPKVFDLLSIDVDGNDFWLWWALLQAGYRPRSVIIEFLRNFGAADVISRYSDGSDVTFARGDARNVATTGSSLASLVALASEFGYRLVKTVCCFDAFFVRDDLAPTLPTLQLEEMDLTITNQDSVRLLHERHSNLYTTAAEVLKGIEAPLAVPHGWSADCLAEAMGSLCDDELTGQLCYKKWD